MQTTLLGLAIALILALFAALIGPFVIDWNQFRGPFEAEATRLLGAPVRVAGPLDARLLPVPSLRLRDVTVGGANDPGRIRAAKLDVDFSLGALLRGELRAEELSLNGVSLDLGLDSRGRLDWPAAGLSNLAALTVDRLNLTGRIALHDAASRSTVELSDIAFSGELRAQAVALRGDGNFLLDGRRTGFRLSTGQAVGGGTRLRLSLNQGAGGIAAELDGVVEVDGRMPRFEGTAMLAALASTSGEPAPLPWRLTAKLKADPAAAKLDTLELSWGAEDRALKLAGSGDLWLGTSPRLDATLSARQLDADRLLVKDGNAAQPTPWLPRLRELAASLRTSPVPARIALEADQIMLGGRPVTDVAAELRSAEDRAWRIARLELRAPGGTRLALGAGVPPAHGAGFQGTVKLEAADPDLLASWLQGRAPTPGAALQPLRIDGGVSVSADSIVLDPLNVAAGGGVLAGRLAYRAGSAGRGSRLDTAMKGDAADLGVAGDLVRALAGPGAAWPDEADVALDLGKATAGPHSWQPLRARFGYDARSVRLDRLAVGTPGGVMLEGKGTLDRGAATGQLDLTGRAPSLKLVADAIHPVGPALAARLTAIGDAPGPAQARLALHLDPAGAKRDHVTATATISLDAPQLAGRATLRATPTVAALSQFDRDALARSEIALDGELSAPRGDALLAVLGLDHVLAAGDGAATLHATATGAWRAPLRLTTQFESPGLGVEASGSADPWAAESTASLALNARRLDLAPVFDLPAGAAESAALSGTAQLAIAGRQWTFKQIDAGIGGAHLRGRLALGLGDTPSVEGEAGIDTLALAPVLELALGAAGRDSADPLGRGTLGGWRGRLAFRAVRATLPGGSELQPLAGDLRSDGTALTLDASGKLGGGDTKATITAKPTGAGVALEAAVAVTNADGAALHHGALAMPSGKVAVQATLASVGRSASALLGALSGGGTVTLDRAQIPGLDPTAFDAAIRAADAGQPVDDGHLAAIVEPVLAAGKLPVASAQFPLSVIDGRLRVAPTTLQADQVRAVISGGYDIAAGQADLRATLAMAGTDRELPPEIRIFAAGPPDRLARTTDLSALASWLAIRRIDRETRKLQALEQEAAPPLPIAKPPAGQTPAAPPGADPSPAQTSALPVAPRPPDPGKPAPTGLGPDSASPPGGRAAEPTRESDKGLDEKGLDRGSEPAKGNPAAAMPAAPPLPDADPRRVTPKPGGPSARPVARPPQAAHAPSNAAPPNTAPSRAVPPRAPQSNALPPATQDKIAPLPPPLEIRPAPGDARPTRPRPPVVLSPPSRSGATVSPAHQSAN